MDEFGENSTAFPLTRVCLFNVAQTFLSAVSQAFQPAALVLFTHCWGLVKGCRQECRRYGRQECLRYAIGGKPDATILHA
jgi:hypothetical protein